MSKSFDFDKFDAKIAEKIGQQNISKGSLPQPAETQEPELTEEALRTCERWVTQRVLSNLDELI